MLQARSTPKDLRFKRLLCRLESHILATLAYLRFVLAGCEASYATNDPKFSLCLLQALLDNSLGKVLVCLRLHKLERVLHRLVFLQLLVGHGTVIHFLGIKADNALHILHLKVNLLSIECLF